MYCNNVVDLGKFVFYTQISNLMFHSNNLIGVDLLSYDIQRGRDTGLPPYNKIRELCGLPVAKSFTDLIDVMPLDVSHW
jgi:hypothetical protein